MKDLAKNNQNYLFLTMPMLQIWCQRMREQQSKSFPMLHKALPLNESEKSNVNFSDWDIPKLPKTPVIEEYLWGVRCGVSQYIDVDNAAFFSVLQIAASDEMSEIYSPAKVVYYLDGSREVIAHQVSAYNTEAKFACYGIIDSEQAAKLFPAYGKIFDALPAKTKFLCSPDSDKLRIASQEKGEIGFNFNYANVKNQNIAFRLGCLRATFNYIASQTAKGAGKHFCMPCEQKSLAYLNSRITFLAGGKYPFEKALELANEESVRKIRKSYIEQGFKGKKDFTVLLDGSFIEDDGRFNDFIKDDGVDITICVPPSVYESWGKPFAKAEREIIERARTFDFDYAAENDVFSKLNRLRFDDRQIRIFRQHCKKAVIEVEKFDEIIGEQVQRQNALFVQVQKIEEERRERERQRRYAADLSGPSRGSIYTYQKLIL